MFEPFTNFDDTMQRKLGWHNLEMFRLPDQDVIPIVQVLQTLCKDKLVLDIGCYGSIAPSNNHKAIVQVAKEVWGVDQKNPDNIEDFTVIDLEEDSWDLIPEKPWDFIVATEVIEHMRNPGNFVKNLSRFKCPIILSTPNPSDFEVFNHMLLGVEIGNSFHFCLFTVRALMNLVHQYGFNVTQVYFVTADGRLRYSDNPFLQSGVVYILKHISLKN